LVSQKGGQRYLEEDGPTVVRLLTWLLDLLAYLALLTDQLPGGEGHSVRFQVERSGSPTVGSALLRILYAIPRLIVLAILLFVAGSGWLTAAFCVLYSERSPDGLCRSLWGVPRWEARLSASPAPLAEHSPPFTLESAATAGSS